MYTISPKIKSERNIVKISPDEKDEYFFGGVLRQMPMGYYRSIYAVYESKGYME